MEGLETWSVVKFLEEDSVSVVPTKWINNDKCLWPSLPPEKITNAIRSQMMNTCWPMYKVSVFKNSTYDDYNVARTKARRAEETSDLTSDDEFTSKRRRIIRRQFSSDEEKDEQETIFYKPPPKLEKSKEKAHKSRDNRDNGDNMTNNNLGEGDTNSLAINLLDNNDPWSSQTPHDVFLQRPRSETITESLPVTPTGTRAVCGDSCTCCPHVAKFMKEILRQQHLTRALLNDIYQKLDQKEKEPQEIKSSIFRGFDLPVKSKEEFTQFNDYLKNETNFSEAVDEITKMGGSNIYDFVKRVLTFFIINDLAVEYSWLGRRTKECFSDLPVAHLVIAAADKSNKASDKKATEEAISKWLRRAGDRKKTL